MSKDLVDLTDQEHKFIDCLFLNGGNLFRAAEESGYAPKYAYRLRNRLAKAISQAAQEYLSVNSLKAAHKLVESVDSEMPNALHMQAATALLDRVGIIKKDFNPPEAAPAPVIKANIFILPEKKAQDVINGDFSEVNLLTSE